MQLLVFAWFLFLVRFFYQTAVPRRAALNGWESACLGGAVFAAAAEILGFRFTLSSTLSGLFGACLGVGYWLACGARSGEPGRRRVLTSA